MMMTTTTTDDSVFISKRGKTSAHPTATFYSNKSSQIIKLLKQRPSLLFIWIRHTDITLFYLIVDLIQITNWLSLSSSFASTTDFIAFLFLIHIKIMRKWMLSHLFKHAIVLMLTLDIFFSLYLVCLLVASLSLCALPLFAVSLTWCHFFLFAVLNRYFSFVSTPAHFRSFLFSTFFCKLSLQACHINAIAFFLLFALKTKLLKRRSHRFSTETTKTENRFYFCHWLICYGFHTCVCRYFHKSDPS